MKTKDITEESDIIYNEINRKETEIERLWGTVFNQRTSKTIVLKEKQDKDGTWFHTSQITLYPGKHSCFGRRYLRDNEKYEDGKWVKLPGLITGTTGELGGYDRFYPEPEILKALEDNKKKDVADDLRMFYALLEEHYKEKEKILKELEQKTKETLDKLHKQFGTHIIAKQIL